MKALLNIVFFMILCAIIALGLGLSIGHSTSPLIKDQEQKGLSQQIVINFSHVVAEDTPKGLAANHFAQLIKQMTGNKVKIEIFPNGSLYSESDELTALLHNNVQMIAPAFSEMTDYMPEFEVFDLPFAFANNEAIKTAFDGDIGKVLFNRLSKHHIKGLGLWSNGFKVMTSNKGPLLTPKDFSGQRFRIMPSKVLEAQFHQFHATTAIMPFNQVYSHLEHHSLDGEENTISNIYSKKFYQVQKYMTLSNHGYLGYVVLMNQDFWNSLPQDIQTDIQKAMNETSNWLWQKSKNMNAQQLKAIQQQSSIKIYHLSNNEKRKWESKLQPLYKTFEPDIGKRLMSDITRIKQSK